ncbi:MAG: FAD-dependent oxidoreductase [Fidelibacterota bacterium]
MSDDSIPDLTISPDRLERQFSDSKPLYTESEAIIEANRCLNCYDAPCISACPTGIDIPSFIKKIASGNIRGSAKVIFEANMLGYSTGRVCPVEELCVGACVYNDLNHSPIQIGRLQRYATEKALEEEVRTGKKLFPPNSKKSEKRVALIGGGPASLACAAYLALDGVKAVIFEKDDLPGGLNTTAVAPYKFQTEDSIGEANWILRHGIELRRGIEVGKDIQFDELIEAYDAVFIGIGLGRDGHLALPGSDGPDVWGATDLIRQIKNNPEFLLPEDLHTVLVIGGGNTAIDISRELAMLGVEDVRILYRRSRKEMRGYNHEMAGASHYGVRLVENVMPARVIREGDKVKGLQVNSTVSDESFEVPCDWVVEAIGQQKHVSDVTPNIEVDEMGRLVVDSKTRRTGHPKVYAGGDCINGGKEVVNAAEDGREAASNMLKTWGIEPSLHGEKYFKSLVKHSGP